MDIIKIFSEVDTEERLYSVLLDKDEVLLFSEFQKEFARKDYEGLTEEAAEYLREKRNKLAEDLKTYRKTRNDLKKIPYYDKDFKDIADDLLNERRINTLEGNRKRWVREEAEEFDKRVRESKKSIAKHQKVADSLRRKKYLKIGAKTAAGILAVAGAAYGAKKYMDSKKKDKE